ncbi:precorrin-8X methylmutase [Seleniivibrio woodruffii]|uniref:precorrin-8X methylmutase n=1 Tax=Seleniivibrio woodruffii TaxID=1078050 RepID=UPI00240916BA|nr:precorrin-8X methylmutase [Seleniivibrio woodruffii]
MNKGDRIEKESFEIIEAGCDLSAYDERQKRVVMRLIHTTGDFEFAKMTLFSPNAIDRAMDALDRKLPVICDVNMVKTAITAKYTDAVGIERHCFIADEKVAKEAAAQGKTRAEYSIEYAAENFPGAIYAVGNAPTALLKIMELHRQGRINPALVIGLPVGFVMAAESKAMLAESGMEYITNIGTKGGSPCAGAVMNALIKIKAGI